MSNIESLLPRRIQQSRARIEQAEHVIRALGHSISEGRNDLGAMLHNSLLWRDDLLVVQRKLDESRLILATLEESADVDNEIGMLTKLRADLDALIETISGLTSLLRRVSDCDARQ